MAISAHGEFVGTASDVLRVPAPAMRARGDVQSRRRSWHPREIAANAEHARAPQRSKDLADPLRSLAIVCAARDHGCNRLRRLLRPWHEEAGVDRSSQTTKTALVVLAVLGVIAALYLMKPILVPCALALVLACVLSPFTSFFRRVLPVSSTGAAVLLFVVMAI